MSRKRQTHNEVCPHFIGWPFDQALIRRWGDLIGILYLITPGRSKAMSKYKIEIEIYEGNGGHLRKDGDTIIFPDIIKEGICAWMYRGNGEQSYDVGRRFSYPEDAEVMCPWLLDSLRGIIKALGAGKTLGWRYKGTPYEKVIDHLGITTEYVRCIDPTDSGIVVKVIRTKLST
jgi:hypothetical protein